MSECTCKPDCPAVPEPPCPPHPPYPCPPVDGCIPPYGPRCVTKYYNLPLWRANDVTSWLVGVNCAMEQIDRLFHDFALRTGLEGEPDDLIKEVNELKANVTELLEWQKTALQDMTATTQTLANVLANFDLVNEKIRTVTFNTSNLDIRVKSIEQELNISGTNIAKLVESVDQLLRKTDELEKRIDTLVPPNPDGGDTDGGDGNE